MGNLQFQIWVSDQSKNGFVYFYWLFAALPCVISDILIECIGFLENFTKLSEKSYGTTYFINKIEKTFSYWLQNFADNLTRPGTKRFTQDSPDCGWRRWWQGAIITFTVARLGRGMLAQWWPCLAQWRCWPTPVHPLCWRLNVSHQFCGRKVGHQFSSADSHLRPNMTQCNGSLAYRVASDVSSLALPWMLRCWSGSSGEAPLASVLCLSVGDGCLTCAGSHHN